jgi:hypothetical protein
MKLRSSSLAFATIVALAAASVINGASAHIDLAAVISNSGDPTPVAARGGGNTDDWDSLDPADGYFGY